MLEQYPLLYFGLSVFAGLTLGLGLIGLYFALYQTVKNPGRLDGLIDALHRRYSIWRYALSCPECKRRGFVHSWIRIPIPQQVVLAHQGGYPTGAGCVYCGLKAIPVMNRAPHSPTGMIWKMGEWITMPPDVFAKVEGMTSDGSCVHVPMDKIPTVYAGDGPAPLDTADSDEIIRQAEQFLGELWDRQHGRGQEGR